MEITDDYPRMLDKIMHDTSLELSEQDLNVMLENELKKPLSEMDISLVDEILKCFGGRAVTQDEIEHSLDRLREKMRELH